MPYTIYEEEIKRIVCTTGDSEEEFYKFYNANESDEFLKAFYDRTDEFSLNIILHEYSDIDYVYGKGDYEKAKHQVGGYGYDNDGDKETAIRREAQANWGGRKLEQASKIREFIESTGVIEKQMDEVEEKEKPTPGFESYFELNGVAFNDFHKLLKSKFIDKKTTPKKIASVFTPNSEIHRDERVVWKKSPDSFLYLIRRLRKNNLIEKKKGHLLKALSLFLVKNSKGVEMNANLIRGYRKVSPHDKEVIDNIIDILNTNRKKI